VDGNGAEIILRAPWIKASHDHNTLKKKTATNDGHGNNWTSRDLERESIAMLQLLDVEKLAWTDFDLDFEEFLLEEKFAKFKALLVKRKARPHSFQMLKALKASILAECHQIWTVPTIINFRIATNREGCSGLDKWIEWIGQVSLGEP
jgi:hypothetical protein